jgi:cytoskeleton protein RodZ
VSDTTTLRLDRDLPEDGIDLRRCAEIGRLLAAEREARALSVEEVAYRLLLSKRQVQALEEPEPRVFHAPIYFVKALRKYGAYVGLAPEAFEGVAAAVPDEDETRAAGSPRRWGTATAVILALVLAALAGTWFMRGAEAPVAGEAPVVTPAPLPAPPPPAPPAAPVPLAGQPQERETTPEVEPPAPVQPAPTPPRGAAPESSARAADGIEVASNTWVFVRYPDNSTIERGVAAGERIAFRTLPVYVAVGTATGVTLVLGERPVDVSPFISNGQVRITRDQILALTSQR